jgi:hypothetical protein
VQVLAINQAVHERPGEEIAAEIVESLEAALDRFRKVAASLLPANSEASE